YKRTSTMKILIAGDLFISESFKNRQLIDQSVEELFASADYRIVNLESPITANEPKNKILKTGPHLRSSEDTAIPYLKQLHIDMVTLANNHILDYGEQGLIDTLHALEKNNIAWVGAGNNLKEARRPFTIENEGLKIAILNFCEHEWSIAEKNKAGANPLDIIDNVKQIQAAKASHDKVICIIHGGHEYYNLPSPRMQKQYRFYADNGTDAIVGHHTHCPSGCEIYNGVPIIYSLGNFISDWKDVKFKSWYEGYFIKLTIANNGVTNISLSPYFQCKNDIPCLQLMNDDESTEFLKRIKEYSNIIQNPDLLEKKWVSFCKSHRAGYLSMLLSLNRVQGQLLKRNLLPEFFLKKKRLPILLNLFRCEAHKDVTVEIVKQELGDEIYE
ncbi:MAG: CapA family protein, partial [Acidobacteriota bacterium]|nr:CapA family protein [Acidobacteriota bacterium]